MECKGVLLARVQTGVASEQELLAFDAHKASCEDCSFAHQIFQDFAPIAEVQPSDADRILRLATRGVNEVSSSPLRSPRRKRAAAAAFAVVLFGAVGAAAYLVRVNDKAEGSRGVATERSAGDAVVPPLAPRRNPEAERAVPETSREAAYDKSPSPRIIADEGPSPAELFRLANEARRQGRSDLATEGYRKLLSKYPTAVESRIANVSLGRLLLENGKSSQALAHFDAYLSSKNTTLAAEALYGRGMALTNLKRISEERATWKLLLTQYPRSAYATHAQRRLVELER